MKTSIISTAGGYRIQMADAFRSRAEALGVRAFEQICTQNPHRWASASDGKFLGLLNQASAHPTLNLALARTYLLGCSPEVVSRTWADIIGDVEKGYHGATLDRWQRFGKSAPLHSLLKIPLIETEGSHLLAVLPASEVKR